MAERKDGNLLRWLEDWYVAQCDGDWEHSFGVQVETLDNPGWAVRISLSGTGLSDAQAIQAFPNLRRETTQNDWVHCRIVGEVFEGYGGPRNLSDIFGIFRSWAEAPDEITALMSTFGLERWTSST